MSFHRADSDLSRLNRAASGTTLTLDPWTIEVLRLAVELDLASDGLFNCAVGSDLIAMGLLPGAASPDWSDSLSRSVVFLDAARLRVDARVCVDLGGVAKGYAVDRAVEALQSQGVHQATVNAGGDLRVLGADPQPIHVRSSTNSRVLHSVGTLANGAIATSSIAYSGGHAVDGRWRSALIDPRTRRPLAITKSWSVLADRCAVADGLTKVVAASGRPDHPSLRRFGATAFAL